VRRGRLGKLQGFRLVVTVDIMRLDIFSVQTHVRNLWLNNLRHLSLNILGVTRIHTCLENRSKAMSQDAAILLPRSIKYLHWNSFTGN
jgi:hypothetical protein